MGTCQIDYLENQISILISYYGQNTLKNNNKYNKCGRFVYVGIMKQLLG